MTISAAVGDRLSLEVFSFVVRVVTQAIEEGESLSGDRDGDLGSELNIATSFTSDNRPDMCLIEADEAIRDVSTV